MKLTLRHRNHQPSTSFNDLLKRELQQLQEQRRIDEAHILIECRPEQSPAFFISAHLVTPGPDVFAEAVDHTLRAALRKVIDQLMEQIDQRQQKRARRGQNQLKTKAPALLAAMSVRA